MELPQAGSCTALSGYAKWLTVTQEQDAAETIASMKAIGTLDVLVIDSYAIDIKWESILRPHVKKSWLLMIWQTGSMIVIFY